MVLVALTVACAVLAGWLRGGRLRHLADLPFRGGVLVVGATGAQVLLAAAPSTPAAVVLTVLSAAALLTFLWLNRLLAGALLIALGSLSNAAVVLANGAMPVSRDAMIAIGRHPTELSPGRHRLLTQDDALPQLADIVALPLLRTIVSVGDIVLAAGLGLLVVAAMARPQTGRHDAAQTA